MNHEWRLAARPEGRAKESDFAWGEDALPALKDGQIRVRNVYLSLDPTNRIWMGAADSYLPALPLGTVMRGVTLGLVDDSRNAAFAQGDIVQGFGGWQEFYSGGVTGWTRLPRIPGVPMTAFLGAMGHIGFTAYFGLIDIAQPKRGETLVVSAAGGAVGSLAGQMGKILGCRVVGITGSDEKCDWITRELGFDEAINYRKEKIAEGLARTCPNGVDIIFENVGGEIMDAALARINVGARVVLCGLISQYNAAVPTPGPYNFARLLLRRARVQGFLVLDFAARFEEAASRIVPWLLSGELKYRVDMVEGLSNAPAALNRLFDGDNIGKLLVKVSEEPAPA
jgi:hypothetical protein